VPRALRNEYGGQPTSPMDLAIALNVAPGGSRLRALTGAALAYGFTEGGAQAERVSLTDLGRRAVAPLAEGDDLVAKREGFMRPRVVGDFLRRYDESPFPSAPIAKNVLEAMGVPRDSLDRVLELIRVGSEALGLVVTIKDKTYVRLGAPAPVVSADISVEEVDRPASSSAEDLEPINRVDVVPGDKASSLRDNRRVFITHGKNQEIARQIKELLSFGDFEPVLAVEHETVSKPVPQKVMDEMRSCAAAIIHVGGELKLLDQAGSEQVVLNPNVLIEIGAAMALYKGRFILLVERGVTLPSNLQGLYEVRYEGDKLDYDATVKLLKAFNDFKNAPPAS